MSLTEMIAEAYRLQEAIDPLAQRLEHLRRALAEAQRTGDQPLLVAQVEVDGAARWVSSTLICQTDLLINPRKFYNRVSHREFWPAIKVNVSAARAALPEPELLRISEQVPREPYVRVAAASRKALQQLAQPVAEVA